MQHGKPSQGLHSRIRFLFCIMKELIHPEHSCHRGIMAWAWGNIMNWIHFYRRQTPWPVSPLNRLETDNTLSPTYRDIPSMMVRESARPFFSKAVRYAVHGVTIQKTLIRISSFFITVKSAFYVVSAPVSVRKRPLRRHVNDVIKPGQILRFALWISQGLNS